MDNRQHIICAEVVIIPDEGTHQQTAVCRVPCAVCVCRVPWLTLGIVRAELPAARCVCVDGRPLLLGAVRAPNE
jgi:hypothetical protein